MKPKALFWDNDGVLVDTERLYFRANADILAPEGIELTLEFFRRHWLFDSRGLVAVGEVAGWNEEKVTRLRELRDARYSELISVGNLTMPGVEAVLSAVPAGVVQAIVTSSKREHFDIIHSRTKLLRYFQFVLAEGDYPHSKPDPAPYLAALERTGFRPEDCLVIEDSERGLRAASGAGIRCWAIPSELTEGSDFSRAERIIRDISEVLEAF